jgi:hypothetical protein
MTPSLDLLQFRGFIVRPALNAIKLWSQDAENLVIGTALQESRLHYVKQTHGPALGFFQIEPATYYDLWHSFIVNRPPLASALQALAISHEPTPPSDELIGNLCYAAAICRVLYFRHPDALPSTPDDQAAYYKRFYNTPLGAATVEGALPWFKMAATEGFQ